ncbi:MAG: HD domain-containing protein [Bacillota bacterium]
MIDTVVEKMKDLFGDDRRRIKHALDVLEYATFICDREYPGDSSLKKLVELAAVLHDIGIKRAEALYNSSAPAYQHLEGPPLAQDILEKTGAEEKTIQRVCHIVGNHHHKSRIDGPDFQILWEADLLVNMPGLPVIKKDTETFTKMVLSNFKTAAGKKLALELYHRTKGAAPLRTV